MRRHRKTEGFNLAFLDIMSCGLGAIILVFMLVKHSVTDTTPETDLLKEDIIQLELQEQQLQQTLAELVDVSKSDAEKIEKLKARIAQLKNKLKQKDLSLIEKQNKLAALKNDIKNRPIAQKNDIIEDDRGGEENYLIGLKVEGQKILILVDSSASMTDEKLLNIIRRKNGTTKHKQAGPKWIRTKKTVRWLLARVPKSSRVSIIAFNDSVTKIGGTGYKNTGNKSTLNGLYQEIDKLVPEGATNLQKGLIAAAQEKPTNLYLITDGLPTKGESRYSSLNPFANCNSLLGRSNVISGECRVKLFRHTIKETALSEVTINIILLPIEGDPDASNEYWAWTAMTGGLLISPAQDWP